MSLELDEETLEALGFSDPWVRQVLNVRPPRPNLISQRKYDRRRNATRQRSEGYIARKKVKDAIRIRLKRAASKAATARNAQQAAQPPSCATIDVQGGSVHG